MAKFGVLLDNCTQHLHKCFSEKLVHQLADVGLPSNASDDLIIATASANSLIIVTNNCDHFVAEVGKRVARSTKQVCKRVEGLIIIRPSDALVQERVLRAALKDLRFEGRKIGLQTVYDEALQVVVEASGPPKVTRLPRCLRCDYGEESVAKAS